MFRGQSEYIGNPQFTRKNVLAVIMSRGSLTCVNLSGLDLSDIDFSGISLAEADLYESNIQASNFHKANLQVQICINQTSEPPTSLKPISQMLI
jgi:uncharacterized protein YjbI with pentapeptide repeats